MSNITKIIPATGWVAVYAEDGVETAEAIVCFALAAGEVRPMRAEGKRIAFADTAPNFLRVEELAEFDDEEEGDEEEEDEE